MSRRGLSHAASRRPKVSEMISIGRRVFENVKSDMIVHYGKFNVRGLCVAETIVLVGSGSGDWIAGEDCVVVAEKGLVKLGRVDCVKTYLLGFNGRVIAGNISTQMGFIKKARIGYLKAGLALIGAETIVANAFISNAVFLDPHVWFKAKPTINVAEYKYPALES